MQLDPDKDTELRQKVNRETARLPWSELTRHFAAGNVVWIADELDLVDGAVPLAQDDPARGGLGRPAGQIAQGTDAQAHAWQEGEAALWTCVVSPFILVQQQKKLH
jgi:hypothetical protein